MKPFAFVLFVVFAIPALCQDRIPLRDFRSHFVGQRVIINGNFSDLPVSFLGSWEWVKEKKGHYAVQYTASVPASLAGEQGIILAVQASDPVMGPPADQSDDTLVNYGEAIVRLDSGQLIETSLLGLKYGTGASDAFTLATIRDQHKMEAEELGRKLQGKSLYLTNLTRIYDEGLPAAEIQVAKAGILVSDSEILNFPLLSPIPVTAVKYSDKLDATLVELALPDGRRALYALGCISDQLTEKSYTCPSLSMPDFLKPAEIEAIKKRSIYVGMSEVALYMAMGFPQKTNESAIGPNQLIYLSAYVYIKDEKVEEIQSQN